MGKNLHFNNYFQHVEYPVIIGESNAVDLVNEKIEKVSDKNVTVLIRGESGTGKELVARAIHCRSRRREQNFVTVNCAAIPSELLESELFGHVRGAFTGATHDKPGRFEQAHSGTIFLDEIGSLRLPLQAKILQILEDQRLSRLGSIEETPIDVRIIAATNSNLEEEIKKGAFRSDLYYRLNLITILIPPLRERKGDIIPLTNYFIHKYSNELRKEPIHIDDRVKKQLQNYNWPGNIRELENTVKRFVALQKADITFTNVQHEEAIERGKEDLESRSHDLIVGLDDSKIKQLIQDNKDICLKTICRQYIAEVERRAISKALKLTRWNRKKASKLLQVSYKTLLNRIEEYKLMK